MSTRIGGAALIGLPRRGRAAWRRRSGRNRRRPAAADLGATSTGGSAPAVRGRAHPAAAHPRLPALSPSGLPLACNLATSVVTAGAAQAHQAKAVSAVVTQILNQCTSLSQAGDKQLQSAIAQSQALTLINPVLDPVIEAMATGTHVVGADNATAVAPFGPTIDGLGGRARVLRGFIARAADSASRRLSGVLGCLAATASLAACGGGSGTRVEVTETLPASTSTSAGALPPPVSVSVSAPVGTREASGQPTGPGTVPDPSLAAPATSTGTSAEQAIVETFRSFTYVLSGLDDNLNSAWLSPLSDVTTERLAQAVTRQASAMLQAHEHGVGTLQGRRRHGQDDRGNVRVARRV